MDHSPQSSPRRSARARRLPRSVVAWAALWWLLTEGRVDSWWIGVPAVAAASYLSWLLAPAVAWRVSVRGWLHLLPLLARSMLLGAIDVAWRSMHPRLPVRPCMIGYPMRLPDGTSRVFFMNIVSLLPGTLNADVHHHLLTVHVIDSRQPVESRLANLEQAVARAFAVSLGSAPPAVEPQR